MEGGWAPTCPVGCGAYEMTGGLSHEARGAWAVAATTDPEPACLPLASQLSGDSGQYLIALSLALPQNTLARSPGEK